MRLMRERGESRDRALVEKRNDAAPRRLGPVVRLIYDYRGVEFDSVTLLVKNSADHPSPVFTLLSSSYLLLHIFDFTFGNTKSNT